jgi:hypothetical protein
MGRCLAKIIEIGNAVRISEGKSWKVGRMNDNIKTSFMAVG